MSDIPVNILMNVRGNLKEAFGELDAALKKTTGQLDATGKAATATGDALKKQNQTSIMDTANALNNVANAGFNLYNAYDNVMDMQVSLHRSQLQVQATSNSLADAQRRYNAALASGDSEKAAIALADLNLAQERSNLAVERADMIQGNFNETIVRSALTIIPTLIMGFTSLTTALPGLKAGVLALNAAMSANPIAIVVLAIAGLVAGLILAYQYCEPFRNAINAIGSAIITYVKPAIDALVGALSWLGNAVSAAGNAIGGFFNWVGGGIRNLVGLGDAAEIVADKVSDATESISSAVAAGRLSDEGGMRQRAEAQMAAIQTRLDAEKVANDKLLAEQKAFRDASIKVYTDFTNDLTSEFNKQSAAASKTLPNIAAQFDLAFNEGRLNTAAMLVTAFSAKYKLSLAVTEALFRDYVENQKEEQLKQVADAAETNAKLLKIETDKATALKKIYTDQLDTFETFYFKNYVSASDAYIKSLRSYAAEIDTILGDEVLNLGYRLDASIGLTEQFRIEWGLTWAEAEAILATAVSNIDHDASGLATGIVGSLEVIDEALVATLKITEDWKSDMSNKFNMLRASTANELSEMHDDFQWAFEAGDFDLAYKVVANFADMYGISLDQATTLLENFVAKQAEIPKTLKEQLVDKAQGEFEKFQKCMSGKALTLETDVTGNMENLASNITDLIKNGLVGEAQAEMQAYVNCNTNKVATMAKDIATEISNMVDAHNNKIPELAKAAEKAVGAERLAILAEIAEIESAYHTKLPQLQTWLDMLWGQVALDTQTNLDNANANVKAAMDDLWVLLAPFPANVQQIIWDAAVNNDSWAGLAVQLTNVGYNFYGVYDDVVDAFTKIKDAINAGVTDANVGLDGLGSGVPAIVDDVVSEVDAMWAKIRARTVQELADLGIASGQVGVSGPGPAPYVNPIVPVYGSRNLRDLNQMAAGGIVERPTLALLGERGPEAVVPLNGGGGLGGVHIHIDSPLINVQGGIDKATADYTITQVERMLKSIVVEATSTNATTTKRLRKQSLVT